jgi:hypothetical protein
MFPFDVFLMYGALCVWIVLLFISLKYNRYKLFVIFGIIFTFVLNIRYFLEGIPAAIKFFIAIYDPFDNLGIERDSKARDMLEGLLMCEKNECSAWSNETYSHHPAWGVAFYSRFVDGAHITRKRLLLGHIAFNSIAFILMHYQLLHTTDGKRLRFHRIIGYITLASSTIGLCCALVLSTEHGTVEEYGGYSAVYGWWWMSGLTYCCIIMGIYHALRQNYILHRKWMIRYIGAMWGAFWIFRVMILIGGPLLRTFRSLNVLLAVWCSVPLGIWIIPSFYESALSQKKFDKQV